MGCAIRNPVEIKSWPNEGLCHVVVLRSHRVRVFVFALEYEVKLNARMNRDRKGQTGTMHNFSKEIKFSGAYKSIVLKAIG